MRRYRCRSCRAAFVAVADQVGTAVLCPKCGADQNPPSGLTPYAGLSAVKLPGATVDLTEDDDDGSIFVPSEDASRPRRRGLLVAASLLLLASAGVALVVSWPALKRWWHPIPPDPIEVVATTYLKALVDGDTEASARLGTVELPPGIRTYRGVHHDTSRDTRVKGSFAPVTRFHDKLARTYDYDNTAGRFVPKNALGIGAETLDALHEAQEKNEKEVVAKIRSGSPDDLFDAAEAMAKPLAALSKTILAPRKLIPSYQQLVEDARPTLPAPARTLALDFGKRRETWDRLLKRPFHTLKADGPFVLDRAEVTASVIDSLGSSGDPPTPLRLTLTRFRLENGIDTGWKVTSARREGPDADPPEFDEPEPPPPAEKPRYPR